MSALSVIRLLRLVGSVSLVLSLGLGFGITSPGEAWAADGHTWIATQSRQFLSSSWEQIWLTYSGNLTQGAVAPDKVFRDIYNHVYHPTTGYGGALKAVKKWYWYLVGNLSVGNYEVAVFSAGVMSHYLADVANPMHTDSSEAEERVHSTYETDVSKHLPQAVMTVAQLDAVANVTAYVASIAESSHTDYWALVGNYSQSGWNSYVSNITATYLNLAVRGTASLWSSAINASEASTPSESNAQANNASAQIVINEVEQNPAGTDAGFEWVELYNPTGTEVDIGGWTLSTTAGDIVTLSIPLETTIRANAYRIVTYGSQWIDNEDESLLLCDSSWNIVDETPLLTDTSNDARSWQRYPNGHDTNSVSDWSFRTSTSAASNGGEVQRQPTSITCVLSKPSITRGEPVIISGTISVSVSTPVEIEVSIDNGSTWTILTSVASSKGPYSYTWTPSAAGTYGIRSTWSGDSTYIGASSPAVTLTVNEPTVTRKPTEITCELSKDSVTNGSSVTISGAINASVSTQVTIQISTDGGVTWSDLTTVRTNPEGRFSYTWTLVTLATYKVRATWPGNSEYTAATSGIVSLTVTKISTAITCSVSISELSVGSSVTVSGAVTPPLSGITITLIYALPDATVIRTVTSTSDGEYSDTYAPSVIGSWSVQASWEGDSTYWEASSSWVTFIVSKIPSSISCLASSSSITIGGSVAVSGSINPARSGVNVTISQRSDGLWSTLTTVKTASDGSYSYSWTPTSVGSYHLKASWEGDATHSSAVSGIVNVTVTKIVTAISCSVSPSEVAEGNLITVSGSISPALPGRTVTLAYRRPDGTTFIRTVTTASDGSYSDSSTPTPQGSWTVTASCAGDAEHGPAESQAVTLTVTKPPSSITCTASPSLLPYGERVKVTGQIIPAVPNATVGLGYVRPGWLLGSYSLTEVVKADANGTYSHEYAPDQIGSWSITASWSGNDQYLGAVSKTALFTVTKTATTISASVSKTTITEGDEITVSGSIQPPPGAVNVTLTYTKHDGTTVTRMVTTTTTGTYTDAWKPAPKGSWSVTASCVGSETHEGATSSTVSFTVKEKACIIATATYGSELSPEVQYLRGFRNQVVLSTFAGSQFMELFNAWYYSFSPGVAGLIAEQPILKSAMKAILCPLIGILHLSVATHSAFGFNDEAGVAMAGLVASSLIGVIYFSPPLAALFLASKRFGKIVKANGVRALSLAWLISLTLILIGEVGLSPVLMMVATGAFVLTTLSLSATISALSIAVLAQKWGRTKR